MSVKTITVPMLSVKYADWFSRDATNAAAKLRNQYGTIITDACTETGIPPSVVVGFIIVENTALVPDAVSYGCSPASAAKYLCSYGLAQMQVATAFQTIKDQSSYLTPKEANLIQKYLPGFIKVGGFVGFLDAWRKQIKDALCQPEFAIWICALHLAQLMKKSLKEDGEFKLDHIIVKYNRGVGNYNKEVVKPGLKNADTLTLATTLPVLETRNYITKFVGVDGSIMAALRAGFA